MFQSANSSSARCNTSTACRERLVGKDWLLHAWSRGIHIRVSSSVPFLGGVGTHARCLTREDGPSDRTSEAAGQGTAIENDDGDGPETASDN